MPFFVSQSAIGVDFNNTSTTALFTLNDIKLGSGDSEWIYVKASGALLTGQMVTIAANGTAILANTTALMPICRARRSLSCISGFFWEMISSDLAVACSMTSPRVMNRPSRVDILPSLKR